MATGTSLALVHGMFVVLPDRSMPHLESRLVKKKVMETESKDLVSESLGVMINEGYHSLFLSL